MEISVEKLAFAKLRPFGGLWLLDLHDHVALLKNVFCRSGNFRTSGDVAGIIGTDTGTCLCFNPDFVAMGHIFTNRGGGQSDTIFMVLDFLRAADTHKRSSHFLPTCRGSLSIRK